MARSSMTDEAALISGSPAIADAMLSAASITLPLAGVTLRSASMRDNCLSDNRPNPLNTDSTTTIAAVATATPVIDMADMTLTALCLFFDIRYLKAILSDSKYFFSFG